MRQDPTVFYATIAGLLPVLLLALVLEGRLFGSPPRDLRLAFRVLYFVTIFGFCAFAVAGEAVSLHVLLGGRVTEAVRRAALLSVIEAGGLLVLVILYRAGVEVDAPEWLYWPAVGIVFAAQLVGTVLVAI